jgi:hypothetical protein
MVYHRQQVFTYTLPTLIVHRRLQCRISRMNLVQGSHSRHGHHSLLPKPPTCLSLEQTRQMAHPVGLVSCSTAIPTLQAHYHLGARRYLTPAHLLVHHPIDLHPRKQVSEITLYPSHHLHSTLEPSHHHQSSPLSNSI